MINDEEGHKKKYNAAPMPQDVPENLEQENLTEAAETDKAEELIAGIREEAQNAIDELTNQDQPYDEVSAGDAEAAPEPVNRRKKGRLTAALENILNESPDTISDELSEKPEADEPEDSVKKRGRGALKRHLYSLFGLIMVMLAVVGGITVVKYSKNRFQHFTAGEDKKDGFIDIIYPAVIMDIETFASPQDLPSEQIISAALWSLVMSGEDLDKYTKTFDVISVPAIDVEAYAAKLFGDSLPGLVHQTVGSGELKFYYNTETASYNVSTVPITFTYSPDITSVTKDGDVYTVTVDYIQERPQWMQGNEERFGSSVSKTVKFTLNAKDDNYVISSMEVLNVNEVL